MNTVDQLEDMYIQGDEDTKRIILEEVYKDHDFSYLNELYKRLRRMYPSETAPNKAWIKVLYQKAQHFLSSSPTIGKVTLADAQKAAALLDKGVDIIGKVQAIIAKQKMMTFCLSAEGRGTALCQNFFKGTTGTKPPPSKSSSSPPSVPPAPVRQQAEAKKETNWLPIALVVGALFMLMTSSQPAAIRA